MTDTMPQALVKGKGGEREAQQGESIHPVPSLKKSACLEISTDISQVDNLSSQLWGDLCQNKSKNENSLRFCLNLN